MTVLEKSQAAPILEALTDPRIGQGVEELGRHFVRYALVLVLAWMGLMKFTEGVVDLVAERARFH